MSETITYSDVLPLDIFYPNIDPIEKMCDVDCEYVLEDAVNPKKIAITIEKIMVYNDHGIEINYLVDENGQMEWIKNQMINKICDSLQEGS